MTLNIRLLAATTASALVGLTACASSSSTEPRTATNSSLGEYAQQCASDYEGILTGLPEAYPDATPENLSIGFSQPLGANETVGYLQRFTELATEEMGGTFTAYDAEGSPDKQVTQMQQLINQKVDAIIVFPLDATALDPVVAQARKADIPVIGVEVNTDPEGDIGQFSSQLLQGRDFHAYVHACTMSKLHPGGEVATIKFAVPVPSIEAYAQLVTERAEEFGLDVVGGADNQSDDVAGGETAAGGLLAKFPDLVGVFAYNDPSAIGASTAARTQSREITSFGVNGGSDGIAAVESGRTALTIQFPLEEWGKELVKGAYAAVQNPDTELPKTVYPTGFGVYTEDNIEDAVTWEAQYNQLTQ